MDKIGILERQVADAFNAETHPRFAGFCIFIELPEHLAFPAHKPNERNGMAVRRIAAGRGGETELVEKDAVDPQVDGKIDVAFENLQPGTAGRTGDHKGFIAVRPQKRSRVAEIVEFPMFGSVQTFDGNLLPFSGTI